MFHVAKKRATPEQQAADVGPTGCGIGEGRRIPGRNGGTLTPHEPGSNGGVRRGPDLQPRRIMQAVMLKALSSEGILALSQASKRSGAAKQKRARARHAMVENTARAMQRIMLEAAEGNGAAYGPAIRLIHEMHEILQPTRGEGTGAAGRSSRDSFGRTKSNAPLERGRLTPRPGRRASWTPTATSTPRPNDRDEVAAGLPSLLKSP